MPFVSITRLRIRSWRFLPMFYLQAIRSARQAAAADGNIHTVVLREQHNTFWTATTWRDEAAMRAYMLAGVHKKVMRKLLDWCDEAAVAHWTQDDAILPTWDEAYARLLSEGRKSKVRHPTAAHNAHAVAPPVWRPGGDLRFR